MAEETDVVDEVIDDQVADDQVTDQKPADEDQPGADDKKADGDDTKADGSERKETKTLLSDDEGDGSDEGVPEKYEFTPPEGIDLSEDAQTRLEAFGDTAREMNLSQEQYQSLIEYDIERGQKALVEAANGFVERVEGWAGETKADKELGGDALNANLGTIKAAQEKFGSPALAELVGAPSVDNPNGLGLGNHPEFLRLMLRVGKALGEDTFHEGDGHKASDGDSLKRMYPSMFKEAS
ncbi:hypothetical protein [uncultured Sneathiella sp.]|uniref:hypothetical protein n=1 Tax=uncultured Sneathiella sp. TaxID=879315 RepID=UPI0030EC2EB4|tara:strand:+ start:3743 stop:4456 length:714 start_codon:yes stop_codon:yes gene_type:complete